MLVNSNMSLSAAIQHLRGANKQCSPSINVDGSISMGESRLCEHVAFITDTVEEITAKMRKSQCNQCGMVSKLPPQYRAAIGFNDRII